MRSTRPSRSHALTALGLLPLFGILVSLTVTPTALADGTAPPAAVSFPGPECGQAPSDLAAARNLLTLLNRHRAAVGAVPLELNATLSRIARAHTCAMAAARRLGHDGPAGSSAYERFISTGLPFSSAGENVGVSTGTPLFDGISGLDGAMMAEPPTGDDHHANIIDPAFTDVGLGVLDDDGVVWLTEDFMGP